MVDILVVNGGYVFLVDMFLIVLIEVLGLLNMVILYLVGLDLFGSNLILGVYVSFYILFILMIFILLSLNLYSLFIIVFL